MFKTLVSKLEHLQTCSAYKGNFNTWASDIKSAETNLKLAISKSKSCCQEHEQQFNISHRNRLKETEETLDDASTFIPQPYQVAFLS